MTEFVYDDGGRSEHFKGVTGDCVVRAITIAAELPYKQVYDDLFEASREYKAKSRSKAAKRLSPSPRTGVYKEVFKPYLESLGWEWTPTMAIGSGCQVHLRPDELPSGRIIVNLSRHIAAVIDGVVHDLYDPSREGTRCVYGYWSKPRQVH